jgi:hypothetical protein
LTELYNVFVFTGNSKKSKVTILWNLQGKTNTTISNNKLDNVIRDNEKRTCPIIYIAISGNRNVIKKKNQKYFKKRKIFTI